MKTKQEVEGDRAAHRKRPIREAGRTMIPLIITTAATLSLAFLSVSNLPGLAAAAAPTTTQEAGQVANTIAKRIKSFQVSACDGEQLSIKCNDDYLIDVITAEYTVLTGDTNAKRANLASTTTTTDQPTTTDTKVSNKPNRWSPGGEGDHDPQAGNFTCPAQASTDGPAPGNATICGQPQASRATEANREPVSELVRFECHLRNSCSIDLRRAGPGNTSETISPNATQSSRASRLGTSVRLARLNEACAANRKLLEIVYKCRPNRLSRRHYCRGQQMQLECPPGKRIVFGNLQYGGWANETKPRERCLQEQQLLAASQPRDSPEQAANGTGAYRDCLADESIANELVNGQCLYRQHCRLEVQPSLFGQPHCPAHQPEYLKVIFVCLSQEVIAASWQANQSQPVAGRRQQQPAVGPTQAAPQNEPLSARGQHQQHQQQQQQLFASSNATSFSLLSNAQLSPPVQASSSSAAEQQPTFTGANQQQQQQSEMTDLIDGPGLFSASSNSSVFTLVASDPNYAKSHPKHWSPSQKVSFLLARYQPQLLAFTCFVLSTLLLALLVGGCQRIACRRRPGRSSNSSSLTSTSSAGSKNSTKSSTSTLAPAGAAGATATLAAPQLAHHHHNNLGQHQPQLHQQHNSCSESCFSLDGFSNHSPALDSIDGLFMQQQQQQATAARPKLWSIYSQHQQQHHNQQQLSTRNTRTFLGPPPPPQLCQQHQQAVANSFNANNNNNNNWCAALQLQQQQLNSQQHFEPHFAVLEVQPPNAVAAGANFLATSFTNA